MSHTTTPNVDFDPIAPATLADPGAAYGALAAACPFHHFRKNDQEWWISSDYEEIRNHILQDNPVWSFKWGNAAKDTAHDTGIVTDPPFHNAFRAVLLPGFTAKAMAAFRPQVEQLAAVLVERMLEKSAGDLHDDFALPLPAQVMCTMLGLPTADYLHYKHWADELQALMFHDPVAGSHKALFAEIYRHCMSLVEDRRALLTQAGIVEPELQHLGSVVPDDYLSRAVCSRVDGRRLTDMEIVNIFATFLTGGQETTTGLLTNCLWRLLQVPERWEMLKADPRLIDIAVEESLRHDPPVLAHFRTSLCPVEMHREKIPERAKLMFSIAGANRDPQRFPEPQEFRLDRPMGEVRQHLSFGAGVHFCIGAPLARMEAQIALRLLTQKLPRLRLVGETERIHTWMYWGRSKMPAAWD